MEGAARATEVGRAQEVGSGLHLEMVGELQRVLYIQRDNKQEEPKCMEKLRAGGLSFLCRGSLLRAGSLSPESSLL